MPSFVVGWQYGVEHAHINDFKVIIRSTRINWQNSQGNDTLQRSWLPLSPLTLSQGHLRSQSLNPGLLGFFFNSWHFTGLERVGGCCYPGSIPFPMTAFRPLKQSSCSFQNLSNTIGRGKMGLMYVKSKHPVDEVLSHIGRVYMCCHSDALQWCSDHMHLHVTNSYFFVAVRSLITACCYSVKAAKNNRAPSVWFNMGYYYAVL